jgi:hypothetical protein
MSRRGRPRADHLDLLERVVATMVEDQALSANEVLEVVGGRRADVLRCVKAVRQALAVDPCSVSTLDSASPCARFPNPQSGGWEEAP